MHLAHEKSVIKPRSSNISHPGENVACARPSVSHEEDEIQNTHFEYDESETNNANVNNYLDSANMAMNLETAMKIAEEEDLWIGDSGASSHMMGSEEHVFNKKLISGSVRTANGAHMKMLCEGDINVDVITKKW